MSAAPGLLLLSRPGCHLCDEMKKLLERVLSASGVSFVERNIEEDDELLRRYVLEIPVLLVGGEVIARHRAEESAVRARLEQLGVLSADSARR